ncbi:MAG: Plug and carboxypeptidase regulatory-like domain-containing protein, partial [Acidobacteriaceae bacterium]|nr:Plug and carboxypeptidase regulatory-like domain-containing protein [Acidobacteriaceae bacterium]
MIGLAVIHPCVLHAQFLDQGGLTGVVQDATGAVIPGAVVTLTNPATSLTLSTKADTSGMFVFSPIKIGQYSVTASADGFQKTTQQNITVFVGQRSSVTITLKTGSVNEVVTVTDAPPLLQTQESSTGQVFTIKELDNTPLNGRNVMFMAQMAAGVAATPGSRAKGTGDFSANGMRAEQNNYVLDGVDNNAVSVDFLGGAGFMINPPPDALEQFKISTSSYSAEFGRSAGAVVIASLKSGTNDIHGSVWEYLRNDYLDARDWLLAPGAPSAAYRQNLFGAALGLPIRKNHLFFFGDIQANRIMIDQPQGTATVPTLLERTGDLSELLNGANLGGNAVTLYQPGNSPNLTPYQSGNSATMALLSNPSCATPNTIAPTASGQVLGQNVLCSGTGSYSGLAEKVLNMYPKPNVPVQVGAKNTYLANNNYSYSLRQPQNTVQWDTRLDWNVNAKDQAFARFSYINQRGNNEGPMGPILDGGGGNGNPDISGKMLNYGNNFVLSETHIFNPNVVNEFRFAYNYGKFSILNPGYDSNDAADLGFGGIPYGPDWPMNGGMPSTTISG